MKYIINLDKQIKVTGFGLVFNQHCTDQSRRSKGPYLAKIFRELLAKLGEQKLQGFNSFVATSQTADAMSQGSFELAGSD